MPWLSIREAKWRRKSWVVMRTPATPAQCTTRDQTALGDIGRRRETALSAVGTPAGFNGSHARMAEAAARSKNTRRTLPPLPITRACSRSPASNSVSCREAHSSRRMPVERSISRSARSRYQMGPRSLAGTSSMAAKSGSTSGICSSRSRGRRGSDFLSNNSDRRWSILMWFSVTDQST